MQLAQKTFLENAWEGYRGEQPKLWKLREKLLSYGGEQMVPCFEDDLDKLLNRGILINYPIIKFNRGRPISCHSNSAACWYRNRRRTELMTGWGLSKDGLWRQHSWVRIIKSEQVIETTIARVVYFGFVMTEEEAYEFLENNPS